MVFAEGDQPVALHFTQLGRQRAAVCVQVIRELLAVERDVERIAAALHRLRGQVGQQPPAQRLGRGMEDLARQGQVFARGDVQQAAQQRIVVFVFARGGRKQLRRGQEQHLARLGGDRADHHRRVRHAGVDLREHRARGEVVEDGFVAPCVVALNGDAAGQHDAQRVRDVAHAVDGLALGIALFVCAQAVQQGGDARGRDAREQAAARQDRQVHISSCFVVMTTYGSLSV